MSLSHRLFIQSATCILLSQQYTWLYSSLLQWIFLDQCLWWLPKSKQRKSWGLVYCASLPSPISWSIQSLGLDGLLRRYPERQGPLIQPIEICYSVPVGKLAGLSLVLLQTLDVHQNEMIAHSYCDIGHLVSQDVQFFVRNGFYAIISKKDNP